MSFVYDHERKAIVDPDTGDTLQQHRPHYQEPRWYQTILDSNGRKIFGAIVLTDADGALANPQKPGDHVLAWAVRYDAEGASTQVPGHDRDLRRIIEYIRQQSDPDKPFTFSDARNGFRSLVGVGVDYRFTLWLGLVGLAAALGWNLAQ